MTAEEARLLEVEARLRELDRARLAFFRGLFDRVVRQRDDLARAAAGRPGP